MKPLIPMFLVALIGCSPERAQPPIPARTTPAESTNDPTTAANAANQQQQQLSLEARVISEEGHEVGSVRLTPASESGVRLQLDINGLSPGLHAVHLLSRARCQPPGFFTAGGHFDPAGGRHGKPDGDADFNDLAHHAGDMLNQSADENGRMSTVIVNNSVSLVGRNDLLDEDGSALVVYAGADDYATQPSGNAGRRIACAEISARDMREST